MRLCRYLDQGSAQIGFYSEESVIPLCAAAEVTGVPLVKSDCILEYLPGGRSRGLVQQIERRLENVSAKTRKNISRPTADVILRTPVATPGKILLLAGNYAAHIQEGGGKAEERANTFPYVFMKPVATTLNHPGAPVRIPKVSPDHIDWELELGIVIGSWCSQVKEAEALNYVAGYTVVNDISDRKFRPNPGRNKREKDSFFDWQHGKWHDTFCPVGPAILPADEITDPQTLKMNLKVSGNVEQDASTSLMVFPVASIIEFISQFVSLAPGDIISTGTPAGVGSAKGKFLKPGDVMEAAIERIGTLVNPVIAE